MNSGDKALLSRLKSKAAQAKFIPNPPKLKWINGQWKLVKKYYENYEGRVLGRLVTFDPVQTGDNLNELPLAQLNLEGGFDSSQTQTNSEGQFVINDPSAPPTLNAHLLGRWVDVTRAQSPRLEVHQPLTSQGPNAVVFNESGNNEFQTAQTNAYYHVNFAHEWLINHQFSSGNIDFPLPVSVNNDGYCNAFYDNASLNFYLASPDCINAAFNTIIYHEFGHFIDDKIGGIFSNDGLSEGWGDVFSAFISKQPRITENFYHDKTGLGDLRSALNNCQYNSNDEAHESGQAWAGFAWDLRELLSAKYGPQNGVEKTENLIFPVMYENPTNIPDAINDVFLRDSGGDVKNIAPDFDEINQAAHNHGIELEPNVPCFLMRSSWVLKVKPIE